MLHSLRAAPGLRKRRSTSLVVSSDAGGAYARSEHGAAALTEERAGPQRRRWSRHVPRLANKAPSALLVLASDLPLAAPSEIDAIFDNQAAVVIVPDRRGIGTNALLLRPPEAIDFAFGENSFQRHTGLALQAGATMVGLSLPGLAFDVDLPEDWTGPAGPGLEPGSS